MSESSLEKLRRLKREFVLETRKKIREFERIEDARIRTLYYLQRLTIGIRNGAIWKMRASGAPYKEISKRFGLSVQRCRQIYEKQCRLRVRAAQNPLAKHYVYKNEHH